ncbi:MAG: Asp-tRNA(Asn)/Glu-tRNA(Gln) amidotransferase subunit GatC [Deltaproteobacteria bacterium]|nr:Asp-tRNA(Asn)/Glu-tRNA(Gln) amidotransferase subunit GatC [Deltaproteobacteria bacterium]
MSENNGKISREEVLKIARLARLELTEDEVESYRALLGRVLGYVKDLDSVETPKDAFVRHVPMDVVCFGEDQVEKFPNSPKLMENAPEKEQGCFVLPPVLEG